MNAPDENAISAVKVKHSDRDVRHVSYTEDDGEEYHFLMTGMNREEWRRYRQDQVAAGSDWDKLESAIERAALSQVRWPDREEVKKLFNRKPGLIQLFSEELNRAAGAEAKAQQKKL